MCPPTVLPGHRTTGKTSPPGLKKFSFSKLAVSFGMILNEATPAQVRIMRDTLPRIPWMMFSFLGPRAYVKYAARLRSANVPAIPAAAGKAAS